MIKFGCVLLIPFIFMCSFAYYKDVQFDINVCGHLGRAANANTIELADEELEIALKFMRTHHLTEGSTSLFVETPANDIGFWYTNLKTAHEELGKISENTSQLEKTNILLKLRETILSHGNKGEFVTCPSHIHLYPDIGGFYIMLSFSLIIALIGLLAIYGGLENRPSRY